MEELYRCQEVKCESYQTVKDILKQSVDAIKDFKQNNHVAIENKIAGFNELIDNKYTVLCKNFDHIKHAHDIRSKHNQYDCDIRTCYYIHRHYKNINKSPAFDLIARIHLYLIHFYDIKNKRITILMDNQSIIQRKIFSSLIKSICNMQSGDVHIKTLKFKWISTIPFKNIFIANKLFIQYFNEIHNWQPNHSKNCIQFDINSTQQTANKTIKKFHIYFKHILLVEGYSKSTEMFIPQSIIDSILLFYAKPLLMQFKKNRISKTIFVLYCPILDNWNSMIKQLKRKMKPITCLYYDNGETYKKLDSNKWLKMSSTFTEKDCFVVSDVINEDIVPEDTEVIKELKNIAKCHIRMKSAIDDLCERLPFEDDTNLMVAETMMEWINENSSDIDLLCTTSEESDDGFDEANTIMDLW